MVKCEFNKKFNHKLIRYNIQNNRIPKFVIQDKIHLCKSISKPHKNVDVDYRVIDSKCDKEPLDDEQYDFYKCFNIQDRLNKISEIQKIILSSNKLKQKYNKNYEKMIYMN